jgi:hypothetical protein
LLVAFRLTRTTTANNWSCEVLEINFENRDDPTVFVFDPNRTVDLIDFWNLRQFRSNVFPINVHWFQKFENLVRKMIVRNFRPLPGNKHGVMIRTTVEFARSIDKETKGALTAAHLKNLPTGSVARNDWYDPIWRSDWRNAGVQPRRAKLTSDALDFEETIDEKDAILPLPSPVPKFASRYSFVNNHVRWINVACRLQWAQFEMGPYFSTEH